MPYFIKQIVGHIPGLTGLFVSCVFAAGLSTMSANLNSLSGVLYEDWIKTWINTHAEPKANVITKSLVIVIGFYCVSMGLVLESFSSILQLVLLVLSVTNGSTLGVYFLGLMWPRANRFGTLWASVISTLSVAALVVYCQLNVASGKVRIPKLDTSIEKCDVIDAVNGYDNSIFTIFVNLIHNSSSGRLKCRRFRKIPKRLEIHLTSPYLGVQYWDLA